MSLEHGPEWLSAFKFHNENSPYVVPALSIVAVFTVLFILYTVRTGHSELHTALTVYQILTATDVPKIQGIPEIPGALPVTGHLLELGDDHATVCEVSSYYTICVLGLTR